MILFSDLNLKKATAASKELLGNETLSIIENTVSKFKKLNTEQCEIVATLFACWNDLILEDKKISDELVLREFFNNWHEKKKRFDKGRVLKALQWMRQQELVPLGKGKRTAINVAKMPK